MSSGTTAVDTVYENTTPSSEEEQLDFSHDDGWQDVDSGEDQEQLQYISLFDQQVFSNLDEMLAHCCERHAFDLVGKVRELGRCVCIFPSSIR